MPKRLTDPNRKPPNPRRTNFNVPSTPWQKLVDAHRRAKGYTFEDLAAAMGENLHRAVVWGWIHTEKGVPHERSFWRERALLLYSILEIDPKIADTAFDVSRHKLTPQEFSTPPRIFDEFEMFIEAVKKLPGKRHTKAQILDIATRIKAGLAPAAGSPRESTAPAPPRPRLKKVILKPVPATKGKVGKPWKRSKPMKKASAEGGASGSDQAIPGSATEKAQ